MKHLTVSVDPEKLKASPELETQFIKLHGREALNKVYSEDKGHKFKESEINNMSEDEFSEKHDEIMQAVANGQVLKGE